jgi:Secretion system C-terminal sorting domain
MRKIITFLILISVPLCSQTFLNVHFNDGSLQNSSLTSLSKISFNEGGDSIKYYLPDVVITSGIQNITQKLTFEDIGQGGTLPVELVSFSAGVNQNKVTLVWRTATEVDNYGFDIERMSSSSAWNKIGFVNGYGNSNSPRSYSFIDMPKDGSKFHYRLKQIDKNGNSVYSIVVDVAIGIPAAFELKQNYPNPFNPSTKIVFNLPADGIVTLRVFDIMGKEVATLVNENKKAGSYEVTLDGSRLTSGVYFCKMSAKNFTSSIKMLFIK